LFSRVNPETLSDTALIVCDQGYYLAGEEEYEASFARERLVIAGFPDRLMTLQKFFSDNPSSKSPFDQSPPHPPGYQ
jgi:hypothetical protein